MTPPRFAAGAGFLRDTCREICEKAVQNGVCGAEEFWHMAPDEIRLRFDAARAAEGRKLRMLDTLAWLAGQYVAVALNAPKRYPARPNRVHALATSEEEMRRVLETMAARARTDGGGEAV